MYRLDGCLADLPPAAILEMLAGGAATVAGLPSQCPNASAAQQVLSDAARFAAALCPTRPVLSLLDPRETAPEPPNPDHRKRKWARRVHPAPVSSAPVLDARSMPISRRTLMAAGGQLPAPDPHPGVRLASVVRRLLGDAPVPAEMADVATGVAELEAPGCSGVGVCVRVCPTDALTLDVVDLATAAAPSPQQFALNMDPERCIDCGLCVQLCPETAVTRVGPLSWAQTLDRKPRNLKTGLLRRCPHCGTPHGGPGSWCEICTFRANNPFGSQLPPGFTRASTPRSQDSGSAREAAPGPFPFDPDPS